MALSRNPQRKELCVTYVEIKKLKLDLRNARTHSKKQIKQIAKSIAIFGFTNPVLIDSKNGLIAGHGRLEAAKSSGMTHLPVIRIDWLSEAQKRALALADNKIALNASWDMSILGELLGELSISLSDEGLDLDSTGFATAEIDAIWQDADSDQPLATMIPDRPKVPISRVGDVWCVGRHRVICGDARSPEVFQRLMVAEKALMVFTDPPYNVRITGHVGGRGKTKHREFGAASGEMSRAAFTEFLKQTLGLCAAHAVDGSIHYVCMDWRHASELIAAGEMTYDELKNVCVWVKTNAGQGSFYRSQHELVFVFKKGSAEHLNTFGLGQGGRSRTNVWTYAGVNAFRAGRMQDLQMHPTVKPTAMVADTMKDCSKRGSIVLDPFLGSGTTLVAAEQVGRLAYGIELDPGYVDVSIERWQTLTGKDAVLEDTSWTFDELRADPDLRMRAQAAGKTVRRRTVR